MITIVFVEESQEEKKRIRGRGRVDREMEWARTRNSSRSPDGVWPVFGLDAVTWHIDAHTYHQRLMSRARSRRLLRVAVSKPLAVLTAAASALSLALIVHLT